MSNKFSLLLKDTGISLTDHQKNQPTTYVNILHKWDRVYNLTSIRDPDEILVCHVLDSIVVTPYLQGERFIDVGTGPGLPGIPLSIVRPEAHFTLSDGLGKRVRFPRRIQHELKLEDVEPVQNGVGKFPLEPPFDSVISHAFASLDDMVNWRHHLPGEQDRFCALKGQVPEDRIALLSGEYQVESVVKLQAPAPDGGRRLVVVETSKVWFLSGKS